MKVERVPWPITRVYNRFICKYLENFHNQIAKEIAQKDAYGFILDVGTGPGRLPIKIAKQIPAVTIVGIDVSGDMIKIARKNAEQAGACDRVKFAVGSAYWTGFDDSTFDLVVSTGLIHHLGKPAEAFNEIFRILKPQREAWMYDGRRDASREKIRMTVGNLEGRGLTLPLWLIGCIWPYMHVGYKTREYTQGIVGEALKESLFKEYRVVVEGGCIKLILRKE